MTHHLMAQEDKFLFKNFKMKVLVQAKTVSEQKLHNSRFPLKDNLLLPLFTLLNFQVNYSVCLLFFFLFLHLFFSKRVPVSLRFCIFYDCLYKLNFIYILLLVGKEGTFLFIIINIDKTPAPKYYFKQKQIKIRAKKRPVLFDWL